MQGVYVIHLPSISALSEIIIMSPHRKILNVVVASSMAAVTSLFWILVLKKLTKFVIQDCYSCKWFRAMHYSIPKSGLLPRVRTEQALPFCRSTMVDQYQQR